jgi:transposase-like protein
MRSEPTTLIEAIRHFSDPDTCRNYLAGLRWPDGVECPTCGSKEVTFMPSRGLWQCKAKHPRRQFSVKVGSIFEDSPIPLDKWFAVIWMLANDKNGISSYEVGKAVGVTQKSAWFMTDRIRLAMQTGTFKKLSGDIEVDETYIGGKARNMHQAKRKAKMSGEGKRPSGKGAGMTGKIAVMGLLDRNTREFHYRLPGDIRTVTLGGTVRDAVEPGSNLFTDALPSYRKLSDQYVHKVIDHAEKYVQGEVHTNGLENFWSLLKRSIKGTYVSIEPFHLFRYLDEQAFRFNNRKFTDRERFTMVARSVFGKRLTYSELTGKGAIA